MNKLPEKIKLLNESLKTLSKANSFSNTQNVINNLIALLGIESEKEWKLFTDSQGKIRSNAGWFMEAEGFADRRASYKISIDNIEKIDLKAYWIKKPKKSIISWLVALTPNFEDEPFYGNLNVGIDFVIPEKSDRVIVVLSKNYVIRTLELSGELSVTQQEIFAKWLQEFDFDNKAQVHEILWQSFDIEPLNKRFYKEVSSFFVELKQHLIKEKVFDDKHASYFVNRLIGRLVFCWFLDKKGIINDKIDYFNTSGKNSTEYYREKLETLFFKVFNTPIEDREKSIDNITPFLNGGLFEEKLGDKHGDPKLTFPADYFDRLVDFLHHYNFTTDESTSTFQQVAIDPEMLGRIFENLLAEQTEETGEQARKAKGAFYTPREIVDYMSRESLRQYLKNKLGDEGKSFELIDNLLDSKEHDWRDQQRNYRDRLKPYKYDILKALDELKVLDPACGSGAFPMGMLSLLLQIYERLDATFDSYKKKLEIIKNNLHGVDIEPMAVEISRLRAWLSIVVDEDVDSNKIQPLPNLDFKFVCANSLIPLDDNKQTQMLDLADKLEAEMQEIREKYFNARSPKVKDSLKQKFNKVLEEKNQGNLFGKSKKLEQLQSYHPFDNEQVAEFFDPKFMYGESHFDMVIGNPPYVRQEQIKYKDDLQINYSIYKSRADLYTYFYEMSLKTLSERGIFALITSSKFMRAAYGVELRKLLKHKVNIKQVIDFGDTHMFAAITNTAIIIAEKDGSESGEFLYGSSINSNLNKISQKNLKDENWTLAESETLNLMKKVEMAGKSLKNWDIQINYGIKTGYNEAYIIDEQKKNELISQDPKNKDLIKPIIRGRDIKKYGYEWANLYIIIAKFDSYKFLEKEYPVIFKHLKGFEANLKKRGQCNYSRSSNKNSNKEYPGQHHWLEFDNNPKDSYIDEFKKEKIIWIELTNKNKFTFSDHEQYVLAGAFLMTGNNLKYLLGVLNSRLCRFYFNLICNSSGMATIQWKKFSVEKIPVPEITAQNKVQTQKIIELVDQILAIKKENPETDTSELEEKIDQLVYKLYDLTDEEIKIVEENV